MYARLLIATACSAMMLSCAQSGENDAIASRPQLSEFNGLLNRTGTDTMLSQGTYTVFAPVNGSFAAFPQERYPYLYQTSQYMNTQEWTKNIAHNHVVPGEVYLGDVVRRRGGVYSINNHFITVTETSKGIFYVNGHKVLNMSSLGNGILYEVDGVIANPWELVEVIPTTYVPAPQGTTIIVPQDTQVIMEEQAPDGARTTTIVPTR